MSNPAQIRYTERATNGVYLLLLEQVDNGGPGYLANCVYTRNFMRKTHWKDGFDFQTKSGDDFRACVFGKIQRSALGTKHSAFGSHFIGKGTPNYITDDTKVKNLFMLGQPMSCSIELLDHYNDQFVTINEIVKADRKEDLATKKTYINKEAMVHTPNQLLTIMSPPKYVVPRGAPERVPMVRQLKRSCNKVTPDPPSVSEDSGHASGSNTNGTECKFKVSDTYDPNVLIDYGRPLFRHVNSQLIQHDISDLDRRIIPPWEEYRALSEGMLVIATVSIHTFIMPVKDNQGNLTGQKRRHPIVDESDSEPEPHYKPFTNEETVAVTNVAPVNTAADKALATFKVKKPCCASPETKEGLKKDDFFRTPNVSVPKTSGTIGKSPVKLTNAPKLTKKQLIQKAQVQRPSVKGKEKAESTASSKSTSLTAEIESLLDEDQLMAEVDDI